MRAVLDASAAYVTLDGDRLDQATQRYEEVIAPELIVAELLNARWKVARSGGDPPTIAEMFTLFSEISLVPVFPLAAAASYLAQQLDHPVYDCFYVALAQREQVPLLTADLRLTRKLKANDLGDLLA